MEDPLPAGRSLWAAFTYLFYTEKWGRKITGQSVEALTSWKIAQQWGCQQTVGSFPLLSTFRSCLKENPCVLHILCPYAYTRITVRSSVGHLERFYQ